MVALLSYDTIAQLWFRISVTMLSRLILNLRMENERSHKGGLSTFSISRAVFAPPNEGNPASCVTDLFGVVETGSLSTDISASATGIESEVDA